MSRLLHLARRSRQIPAFRRPVSSRSSPVSVGAAEPRPSHLLPRSSLVSGVAAEPFPSPLLPRSSPFTRTISSPYFDIDNLAVAASPPGTAPGQVSIYLASGIDVSWLTKEEADRLRLQLTTKLRDLGIGGPVVNVAAYGDSFLLDMNTRAALRMSGVMLRWVTGNRALDRLLSEDMLEFTSYYDPGSYIVLMCNGGSGLVDTAKMLNKLGYHIVLASREGEDICPALRLTAHHCITLD